MPEKLAAEFQNLLLLFRTLATVGLCTGLGVGVLGVIAWEILAGKKTR